jgi:tryptophan synthase alpha chain
MSAIDQLFRDLRRCGRKALMPFITAGDPNLDFTAGVLRRLAARGCHLFELGFPYSDPIADGPVIQASYTRALEKGVKVAEILAMARRTLPELGVPTVAMVSYAIVHRYGPQRFVTDAQAAGFAGAIVPDLLVEESEALAAICRQADFSLVQLVTPTTPRERALRIAQQSTGFLYYVSVTGITGERRELPRELLENVAWLREQTPLPICIGFGISQAEHIRKLAPVADGLIVGSAIVRRMARAEKQPADEVLQDVEEFTAGLLKALA